MVTGYADWRTHLVVGLASVGNAFLQIQTNRKVSISSETTDGTKVAFISRIALFFLIAIIGSVSGERGKLGSRELISIHPETGSPDDRPEGIR